MSNMDVEPGSIGSKGSVPLRRVRPRNEGGDTSDGEDWLEKLNADIATQISDAEKRNNETTKASLAQMSKGIKQHLAKELEKRDDRIDDIVTDTNRHNAEIDLLKSDNAKMATKQSELEESIKTMQATLAMPQVPTTRSSGSPDSSKISGDYENNTILRIGTQNQVAKTAIETIIDNLCDEAGIDVGSYEIKGAGLGTKFTLAFNGTDEFHAARRAKMFHDNARKNPDNTWREHFIERPNKNPDGTPVMEKIFINTDTSRNKRANESTTKVYADVLKTSHPDLGITFNKFNHSVSTSDWMLLLLISIDMATGTPKATWKSEVALSKGINMADIDTKVNNVFAERRKARV